MIEVGDLVHWECEGDKDVGVVVEIDGDKASYKYKIRWISPMQDQWVADFMFDTIMVGKFTIIPRKR